MPNPRTEIDRQYLDDYLALYLVPEYNFTETFPIYTDVSVYPYTVTEDRIVQYETLLEFATSPTETIAFGSDGTRAFNEIHMAFLNGEIDKTTFLEQLNRLPERIIEG